MEQWYQQAAVAMLLSAPSTLHKAWWTGDTQGCNEELNRLGLSDEAKTAALKAMSALQGHVAFLHATSELLRQHMWAGSEPHPTNVDAAHIVAAMRELDQNRP
jgi:hypothetical protein